MRQATIRALEIRDEADIMRGLTRGELEAQVLEADRAQATAPPEASAQLRLIAQTEADAWQQAADAATQHDLTAAERALERQRQAAIVAGNPWPPQRTPQPEQELRTTPAPEVNLAIRRPGLTSCSARSPMRRSA